MGNDKSSKRVGYLFKTYKDSYISENTLLKSYSIESNKIY
jgi:hypothetical protein